MSNGFAETLGCDKPRQRKRNHCPVIPSPTPAPSARKPHNAKCFDGVVWRQVHDWDRDGNCHFCDKARSWEPL